ncbi:MAG: hypothetical protein IKC32_00835 [Clostridia bacterium]|nr:hypothetical protein [Clostridia bacterium]
MNIKGRITASALAAALGLLRLAAATSPFTVSVGTPEYTGYDEYTECGGVSEAFINDICEACAGLEDGCNGRDVDSELADGCEHCLAEGTVVGSRIIELFREDKQGSAKKADNAERPSLLVGGIIFGTRIKETHVTVTTPDEGGTLAVGDRIISINGKDILGISDVKRAVSGCGGEELSIICERGGKRVTLSLKPREVDGDYKLGAVIREGAAGIGTVTYVDPASGAFGGLGHGICDPESGEVVEMTNGTATSVILGGVVKGEAGKPGELTGILTDRRMGVIEANTELGVFGRLDSIPERCSTLLPIAYKSEVTAGDAKILSTLKNGATLEYSVKLSDVKPTSDGTKCFKVTVTDPALLAISGGIVRGMSGSPIIQDGKLVGAVTHVMVANPTEGYGIFIENMLNASHLARNELPAA